MSSERTVVIVGAGVIGLCAAWYARAAGHRVIVVERGGPERDCCSLGNAGMIVPSHLTPLSAPGVTAIALRSLFDPGSPLRLHPRIDSAYLRWCWRFWRSATREHVERAGPALRDLALLSWQCYRELVSAWDNRFGLQRRGLLILCRTQRALEEEAHAARFARQLGVPAETLDLRQTAQLEPRIRQSLAGSVHYPLDAHLTPQVFIETLVAELGNAGVEICWSAPVHGWRTEARRIHAVRTTRGEVDADEFVLASGSWSAQLAADLAVRLPLQAGKGYSLTLRDPAHAPAVSAILSEARVAITPMDGALRVAGTMEFAGLDTSIDRYRVQAMLDGLDTYYSELSADDFEGVRPWSGLRPCTPDGLPYIGRARRYDNLIIATGHAMLGMTLGPATGLITSELISARTPSASLQCFDPDRFS